MACDLAARALGVHFAACRAMKRWNDFVAEGGHLGENEAGLVADALFSADISDEDKAAFLGALHSRGETAEEVRHLAAAFLQRGEPFEAPGPVIDVCGTGGDKLGLFNISTAVMFVVAGAGARVVKHGNRGVTSKSGGADVLEELGVPADAPVNVLQRTLENAGAVFLFAPRFHPAFKQVAGARRLLASSGKASVFNMLGPLLNPARPAHQLTGVFSEHVLDVYATALPALGRSRAWIVHGRAGAGVMDEISTVGPTLVVEVADGEVRRRVVPAGGWNVPEADIAGLRGGSPRENAAVLQGILSGTLRGAPRDIVTVNASAALVVAGLCATHEEAMARAQESLDSGAAARSLRAMRESTGR